MRKNTAVFLDRDGTINEEVGYLDSLEKFKIIPSAYEAIKLINLSGMKAVVVTNQAGVAKGLFPEELISVVHRHLLTALHQQGAHIDQFYYCPHHPTDGQGIYTMVCNCRKPAPGMLLRAENELDIDLARSYMVGDRYRDVETAKKVGVKGVLVQTGYGNDVLQNAGPDQETKESKPDFIAQDILAAVKWILKDRQRDGCSRK